MNKRFRLIIGGMLVLNVILFVVLLVSGHNIPLLDPKGLIGEKQRDLLMLATFLMMLVVVPVYVLAYTIAWRYRASNKKAKYSPDWDRNRKLELIWWGVPLIIIGILAVITWKSTHELDPYRPIASNVKPITIEVVALQWKWLFIYPEQNIATVNYVQFPEKTPVNFRITSDAPMNSFWIPDLGGQVYAMTGMTTKLHLMAGQPGVYNGSSANLSGKGFAGMKFVAKSSTAADFDTWVKTVLTSPDRLGMDEYVKLAEPSEKNKAAYYATVDRDLFGTIVMKYMTPPVGDNQHHTGGH